MRPRRFLPNGSFPVNASQWDNTSQQDQRELNDEGLEENESSIAFDDFESEFSGQRLPM